MSLEELKRKWAKKMLTVLEMVLVEKFKSNPVGGLYFVITAI